MVQVNAARNTLLVAIATTSLCLIGCPPCSHVPDAVGDNQAAAQAAIAAAGLTVAITEAYSDTIPAGSVISQTPAMGTLVARGSAVALIVSKGPKPVAVPDVKGETQTAAQATITAAGLTVDTTTEAYSDTIPPGSVISQTPAMDTLVAPGSAVALVVSKGPEPVAVPDVKGETQAAAVAAIEAAGLTVDTLTEAYSNTIPAGSIITQTPAMGTLVARGSTVSLVVSKGSEPVAVPDVVGETWVAAESTIAAVGLGVGTVTKQYSDTIPACSVISQTPAMGTLVARGSTVSLVVSKGLEAVAVVPDVAGVPEAEAVAAIEAAGLTVGTVTGVYNNAVDAGNAVRCVPDSGTLVALSRPVDLNVSLGESIVQTITLPGDVPLEMVWIDPGTFLMGRYSGEQDSFDRESPQHLVTLSSGFWMGRYELTKAQWMAVMGTTPWSGNSYVLEHPDSPATHVSWHDAQSFITAVNSLTGETFRLPSEAEWEYACRAHTTTRFYWGDDLTYTAIGDYAWCSNNTWHVNEKYAHVVGQRLPNTFGLYDMSGNVDEWCNDRYGNYASDPVTNPTGPASGPDCVIRGCGWLGSGRQHRSAFRGKVLPWEFAHSVGFRLAGSSGGSGPNLATSSDSISLSQFNRSATVTIGNVGEGTLSWTSTSNDSSVWTNPSGYTGNSQLVTVCADDFSESHTAQVTFTNSDNAADWEVVDVSVVGTGGGPYETIMLPGDVPLVMAWIPAGTFMMGRYPDEQDGYDREDPQHPVTLSSGFWMGEYELTKAQWTAVMGTTPWSGEDYVLDDPDSPAVYVSWDDAQAFITALNSLAGKTFRLPSEAEWEHACRAGTTERFYWGDDPSYTAIGDYAWWYGNTHNVNEKYAHVVGQKLANTFGLYDMSGNVTEWCQDWYHSSYAGAPDDGSAWESPTGRYRMLRGGGWDINVVVWRSAYRSYGIPSITSHKIGFRLAR